MKSELESQSSFPLSRPLDREGREFLKQEYNAGVLTKVIAAQLNSRGYRTEKGVFFRPCTVSMLAHQLKCKRRSNFYRPRKNARTLVRVAPSTSTQAAPTGEEPERIQKLRRLLKSDLPAGLKRDIVELFL